MTNKKSSIDAKEILDLIPHRYPFLLVDRIEEIVINQSCIGVKNITINEPFFPGHFPGHPIMPGVMLIEAMAQTASLMAMIPESRTGVNFDDNVVYFTSVDEAKFRKPVVPGDTLRIETTKIQRRGMIWKFQGKIFVDGVLHAEAKFTAMLTKKDS